MNKLKDPNSKIWKIRASVLGPKNKPQVPTWINHPDTGEIITNPDKIKRVTLEHNIKILTKNQPRPEDKELNEQKLKTHNTIIENDNKNENLLEYSTFETVLTHLKLKDKKMYKHITKAGEKFQKAMFKYYEPLVNSEQVPETYNYTNFLVYGKAKAVS